MTFSVNVADGNATFAYAPSAAMLLAERAQRQSGPAAGSRRFLAFGNPRLAAPRVPQMEPAERGISNFFANLSIQGSSEIVIGEAVTDNYFQTLGVRPVIGRAFVPDEFQTQGAANQ